MFEKNVVNVQETFCFKFLFIINVICHFYFLFSEVCHNRIGGCHKYATCHQNNNAPSCTCDAPYLGDGKDCDKGKRIFKTWMCMTLYQCSMAGRKRRCVRKQNLFMPDCFFKMIVNFGVSCLLNELGSLHFRYWKIASCCRTY